MSRRATPRLESRVTTLSTVLISVGLALGGVLLMLLSLIHGLPAIWSALLSQVGGVLVATGLLTAAWDLFGRRAFAAELLARAKLSSEVVESGITRITDQYLDDVEWSELFQGATHVDIVVAYANTWRNTHRARLVQVAATPGSRIRVFLPDPGDTATMANLAQRFAMDQATVTRLVTTAIGEYQSLHQPHGGDVEVYVRAGDALFSAYRFNQRAVLTLYSHGRERRTSVPTWTMASGKLFAYVESEITAIAGQSRRI